MYLWIVVHSFYHQQKEGEKYSKLRPEISIDAES